MALIVRNTFLDFNENDDNLQQARSSSAPPTCRHKGDFDVEVKISAACDTVGSERSTEHSTAASDIESVEEDFSSSRSSSCGDESDHEYEDLSPSLSRDESDSDEEVAWCPKQEPVNEQQQLTEAAAQEQLDKMSQMVMDIWSKLQSVESSIEARCEEVALTPVVEAAPSVAPSASVAASKLTTKSAPFVPGGGSNKASDVHNVFARMEKAVMLVQGVAAVDVNLGPKGTLATITIQLHAFAQGMLLQSVIVAAKSALLEAAANSEATYVLGYEAAPFEDDKSGSSFVAALADCPKAWECSVCWDTYTTGSCRRRRTCKNQHPGRNELQPVRVVVC